jgi:polyhydroxyalkanoate synthase subunit PhaC
VGARAFRLLRSNDLIWSEVVRQYMLGQRRRPVALSDIRVPAFVVGTESDHVAPWRSVFKFELLTDADVTFALTTGGHNIGILGLTERRTTLPPRSYRLAKRPAHGEHPDLESRLVSAPRQEGSWWPAWIDWLNDRSSKDVTPPEFGAVTNGYPVLEEAPGTYVMEQ